MRGQWISVELAIERGYIRRVFGLADWAIKFGEYAINKELRLIKMPSKSFSRGQS